MGGMEREALPYRQPTNRPFSHTYSISIIFCSLKKLHKVQLLVDACNVFYQPNLERQLAAQDNVIGTRTFAANQYDLNFSWAQMEEQAGGGVAMGVGVGVPGGGEPTNTADIKQSGDADVPDMAMRNYRHFTQLSGIDFRSSTQLVFDVLQQMIEVSPVKLLQQSRPVHCQHSHIACPPFDGF